MISDRVFVDVPITRRTASARPSFRLGCPGDDACLPSGGCRWRFPLEPVAFEAAPGTQVDIETVRFAGHDDRVSRRSATNGTLDQQITAVCKRERPEIDP
jgi:hypothetical protein